VAAGGYRKLSNIAQKFDPFQVHQEIPKGFQDVLVVLISCYIVFPHAEIHEREDRKERVNWGL
jgi:hypothetical protein